MASNDSLRKAKAGKNDEFYTQLGDIENECRHYKEHFKGKTILCNCDDPYESNFFKHFAMKFNSYGLKKLIATCYVSSPIAGSQISMFDEVSHTDKIPYKIEITEVNDETGDGAIGLADVEWLIKNKKNVLTPLSGDGDFSSEECVELLKEADIVVTNPPFSLFREFVPLLMQYDKKFLIIGNQNALTYKEIFPLLKNNKIWLGYENGDMAFTVPDSYEPRKTRYWQDETGQKWRSLGNICWFTNLDIEKRHEELTLVETYAPEKYPKYDNYDAINIDRLVEIPKDYDGAIGVPITFFEKHNPTQFEIIGCTESEGKGFSNGLWDEKSGVAQPLVNGTRLYKRVFIKRLATI